eukprot:11159855-Lingulodinium_polyedra.AAC.1
MSGPVAAGFFLMGRDWIWLASALESAPAAAGRLAVAAAGRCMRAGAGPVSLFSAASDVGERCATSSSLISSGTTHSGQRQMTAQISTDEAVDGCGRK